MKESRRSRRRRQGQEVAYSSSGLADFLRAVFCGILLLIILSGLGYFFHGRIGLEKTLTRFAYPVGMAWLILASWTMQMLLGLRLTSAAFPLLCLVGFTLTSVSPSVDLLVNLLESEVEPYDPASGAPLDAIVVLGGGTKEGPTRAEVGHAGDRVLYAAQLFLQGHTKKLISTGANTVSAMNGDAPRPPAQATKEIWNRLGIEDEAIMLLDGLNTKGEMAALAKAKQEGKLEGRLGLVTSATHLPRAVRLAKDAGIADFIPISADHCYGGDSRLFQDCLPRAETLLEFTRCYHELLSRIVNR